MADHLSGKAKEKKLMIASFVVTVITVAGFAFFLMPSPGVGYAPAQPIPYSHALHAGKWKIECQYCHSSVDGSPHSNVPSVAVCMNCHTVVKVDSPYIQQLREAYDNNKPIQWVNVHVLADYVYFNHERHVRKGVSCDTCHGNVAAMEKVEQVAPLTMGWCVNCHRQPQYNAPTDCNTCHR